MRIREPVVAGRFYAAQADRCLTDLSNLFKESNPSASTVQRPVGGLVPHAGWTYSGSVTARVFSVLAARRRPNVVVLFGGVHHSRGREAALFGSGRWETPLGPLEVDDRLADRILGYTNLIVDDPYAHEKEHSIEVQMPFVKYLFPDAKIVPIMVPPTKTAPDVGQSVARTLSVFHVEAVVIGTSDLTHYGPRYGLTSHGVGPSGHQWAKQENDRRMLDLLTALRESEIVKEAASRKNACSGGAAAATVAACAVLGAERGIVLEHTSSAEVALAQDGEEAEDSVGYAGVVFF
jgi:hypothetical protein